jgi:Asp-tRNA(Asn)/Glu-tRNA(Gln) amidotransferase C subunit
VIDADRVRCLNDTQGLELPEEDLEPVASALNDLMGEVRRFDKLEFPTDGYETHFDVDWHIRAG